MIDQEKSRKVVVTGATGFVGRALLEKLLAMPGTQVVVASRQAPAVQRPHVEHVPFDLLEPLDLEQAFNGVDSVIHLAARVHVMNEQAQQPLQAFRQHNVAATLTLAQQASERGVRRFIFISSIKVNGEQTAPNGAFSADEVVNPIDPYGISKWEAEQGLLAISRETGMEVVIVRPVLVYGPGVKANFHSMMKWLSKGIPLPLGAIDNKRSLVALDNLVDLILTCVDHPAAANQVFLASDGEDLSTSELLRRMGRALGKPARLVPVPAWLLSVAASLLGKKDIAQRLCGSLQVDIGKTRRLLDWHPVVTVDAALEKTASHFLEHRPQ
jgi:UDP-glucose 4-epimerase